MTKAREVRRWPASDAFSPLEREVLAYAAAMAATEPLPPAAVWGRSPSAPS